MEVCHEVENTGTIANISSEIRHVFLNELEFSIEVTLRKQMQQMAQYTFSDLFISMFSHLFFIKYKKEKHKLRVDR